MRFCLNRLSIIPKTLAILTRQSPTSSLKINVAAATTNIYSVKIYADSYAGNTRCSQIDCMGVLQGWSQDFFFLKVLHSYTYNLKGCVFSKKYGQCKILRQTNQQNDFALPTIKDKDIIHIMSDTVSRIRNSHLFEYMINSIVTLPILNHVLCFCIRIKVFIVVNE